MYKWLIKFDVRVAKDQYVARRWHRESRAQFLLRPDIEWPLSVDRLVWPSVFYSKLYKPPWEIFSAIEVDPTVEGMNYWLDLDRMHAHYDSHRALAPGGVFVGVELLSERTADGEWLAYEIDDGIQCAVVLEPTIPPHLPPSSSLLGYDVADAGRISGLSNCGYTEEEIKVLGAVWADRLNSFGLLSTIEDAVAFRRVCDQRVPEHAPFWVYALWRLPIE